MTLGALHSSSAVDPVCGMQVNPDSAAGQFSYKGTVYYFCNPHCLKKFQADPEKYLAHPGSEQHALEIHAPAPPGSEYFCPMCPDVRSDRPGPCPNCGMALEPRPGAVVQPSTRFSEMTWAFLLSLPLGLPLVANAMADMIFGQPLLHSPIVDFALATLLVGIPGLPILKRSGLFRL